MIIIVSILLILAFVCFGLMDELAHHYNSITISWIQKNPQFWDKQRSWVNKWKREPIVCPPAPGEFGATITICPPHVGIERFWGSSRWFVFLTDGWHLAQFIAYHLISTAFTLLLVDKIFLALLLSIPAHVLLVTVKSLTMRWVLRVRYTAGPS